MSERPGSPESFNPYRAPKANLDQRQRGDTIGNRTEEESIRYKYLKHEASVKSLGSLYYLGGIFSLVFCVIIISRSVGASQQLTNPIIMILGLYAVLVPTMFVVGYGLSTLKPWARWTTVVLNTFNMLSVGLQAIMASSAPGSAPGVLGGTLIGSLIAFLISSYIFYLLLSSKGAFVFSQPYREIVRLTPHVKYKSGCIIKLGIGLLVFIVLMAVLGGVLATIRR